MKTRFALLAVILMQPAAGSPFVNLTFDQPDLTGSLTPIFSGGPLEGNTAEILQGWSLTVNGAPLSKMTYAPRGTGSAGLVTLLENSQADQQTILATHSLLLRSPFPSQPDVRIRQTGTIPAEAIGLWIGSSGRIEGFANGQKVGEVTLEGGSHAILDIARFAGQEVTLEFAMPPGSSTSFDIFGFTPVPEPSTWALGGVGIAALLFVSRRKH